MALFDQKIGRRAMLSHSARAAALAAMASDVRPLLAAPASRRFKIGACDWSLGKHSDVTAFDIAKQIGLDGVQISMGNVRNDMQLRRPEMQKTYLAAAKRTALEIASLAIGELNNVPLKSDPRAAKWLDESIDICKAMGLTITMPAFFGRGNLDMDNTAEIDHVVKALKGVAPKAEKQGVIIGLENWLSAEDNMKLIDRVGSPAVQVYYDVGNSNTMGYDIYKEIRTLGKMICQFHAKDGRSMLGQGRVDFPKVRRAIDDIDYSGWIVIEAARPNGVISDYTAHCKFLRGIFAEKG